MSEYKFPTGAGVPCWVEIPAADVAACKAFYAALFPTWKFTPATEKYPEEAIAMFSFESLPGLHGGIVKVDAECKAAGQQTKGVGATVYHAVPSIEEAKEKAEKLGGKALSEKIPEGDHGYFMYLNDVEGNRFGIYEVKKSS